MRTAFVLKSREVAGPLGIMDLSSLLKGQGHEVKLFTASEKGWLERLENYGPRIVAYSVITGSHGEYLKINERIRKRVDAVSVFGHFELVEAREAFVVGKSKNLIVVEQFSRLKQDSKCDGIGNVLVMVVGVVIDAAEDAT